jgi:LacI family transcriptional regulator
MTTPRPPTPTLHDVAAAAGVSTATVSRVLNLPQQVSQATQDKVHAAIRTLGYAPNFGARAMAAGRTNTIGAIIPTMANAIFARGLEAFQQELRLHGFTMLVASTSYRADLEEEQIRALVARGADALLLIGYSRDPEISRFLDAQRMPVLVTWAFDRSETRPAIGFDNFHAMQRLTGEVLARGHRYLGLISAETPRNDRAARRVDGARAAIRAAGLAPDALHVIETTYGIEQGATAFARMMARDPRPTAVMCGNDVLAVGALRQARAMGLRVPDDVSITGFDDIELAETADPPLTTMRVPHDDMGREAARALALHTRDGAPLVSRALPVTFIERATLGPAPESVRVQGQQSE